MISSTSSAIAGALLKGFFPLNKMMSVVLKTICLKMSKITDTDSRIPGIIEIFERIGLEQG